MKKTRWFLFLVPMAAVVGCGPKGPVATVELTHAIAPKTPLSQQYMQMAVMNAQMGGDTGEYDQDKWSKMTADVLQHYLEQAAEKNHIPIKLVDREHLKLTMGEKDLAAAGVTDSPEQAAAAKVQGASAIVTSKVTIKIDKQASKKRTVDALSGFASGWSHGGAGGGSVHTSEVEQDARNITVQCQFQLKDAATNAVVASHNALPSQDYSRTKSSPFFGSSKTEGDMTPRDQVIGAVIERQVQEFLSKFIPMSLDCTVQVKPSKHEMSVAGTRALVEDDFETALADFKQAIGDDQDDHESLLAAGVCCERLGRLDEARKYYKRAQSVKPKDARYAAAVERINRLG